MYVCSVLYVAVCMCVVYCMLLYVFLYVCSVLYIAVRMCVVYCILLYIRVQCIVHYCMCVLHVTKSS